MISLTSPVRTAAHGWPAGGKLLALCLATTGLFLVHNLVFQGAAFALCLTIYALPGRLFFVAGFSRLRMLWPFLALIFVWHVVTGTPGQGAVIALRMISAVALANLVTMTTTLGQMIAVVRWLAAPLRRFDISTRPLEIAIAMVVRFTPVLAQKGQALGQSWRARSPRRPGWKIIMPFTLLAIDDAEHVADALRARGGAIDVEPGTKNQ